MAVNFKWIKDLENILSCKIINNINKLPREMLDKISEIRMYSDKFVYLVIKNKSYPLIDEKGFKTKISHSELNDIFLKMCDDAIFKYENQIRNGYITLKGGHRVGFCGSAVYNNGELLNVKNISMLCIRISRNIKNASKEIIGALLCDNKIFSTLICGPPASGKTTVLSDLIRVFSLSGIRSAVIDERSEICSVNNGYPQKDVGDLTSVLDGYSKTEGMLIALRNLSPQVIICDEIGDLDESERMLEAMNSGVSVIATAHASDVDELIKRPQIETLLKFGGIEKLVILKGGDCPCSVKEIIDIRVDNEDFWNCIDRD